MTSAGIARCIMRLTSCPDLAALERIWNGLGIAYQRNVEVLDCKDRMKEQLK